MKIKNFLIGIFLFTGVLFLTSCGKKVIKLENNNIKIALGEEYAIKPSVEKLNDALFDLTLSNNVVEIINTNNYVIKGIELGNCEITISVKDNKKIEPVVLNVEVYLQ